MARMMLLTKANRRALPALYTNDGNPNPTVQVKFFNPTGRGTWYATEFDGDDRFFGYVVSNLGPDCDEWGYFSLSELASVRLPFGLGIERDRHFSPQPIGDVVPNAVTSRVCTDCGKSFTPSYGEYARCEDCLSSQHAAAEQVAI